MKEVTNMMKYISIFMILVLLATNVMAVTDNNSPPKTGIIPANENALQNAQALYHSTVITPVQYLDGEGIYDWGLSLF